VASSVVLVTTTPLWVGLFSPLFLREKLPTAVAVGLVVALAGGFLVGMSEACDLSTSGMVCPPITQFLQAETSLGNLLALAGALFAAAYLMVGRRLRPSLSLIGYITTVYSTAAVTLVIMALISGQVLAGFSSLIYLAFLALAVIPQLLGHSSFNYALGYLSAAYVSVALLGEPIGSTLLALVLLKETPTMLELVGGVIILAGIYLATRGQKEK
jgi:drug/metabolite transporter (DMT)-like permease